MTMTIADIAAKFPGTVRQFKAKSPIIYQGEVPRCGFFIKKGVVKVYNLHSSGNEQILRFYGPGDFFPLPWLYKKVATEFFYYEAVENCEVIAVTRGDVENIIMKDPQLNEYVMDAVMNDQTALNLRIMSLEQPRANEKLEYTLYYLMFRHGKHVGDEQYVINMSLTHIMLANLVGLTRETITTEMNRLRKKEIISYNKKIYKIDRRKLERAIGDDSFNELIEK